MSSGTGVDGLRGLAQDLSVLKNGGQPNLENLAFQLESQLEAFSHLLDKKPRDASSRRALSQGKVTLDDVVYEINQEFQELVIQLADVLDLDELEATRLYLDAQGESGDFDRSPAVLAAINFHEYRIYLLECLRRICELSLSEDVDEQYRELLSNCVGLIVESSGRPGSRMLSFVKRCMAEMLDTESWLQRIAEQVHKNITLSTTTDPDVDEILHAQQESLIRQHEFLATIVTYLIKANKSIQDDFTTMVSHLSRMDKWNMVTVHYVPALLAFTSHYGSTYNSSSFEDVLFLHNAIIGARDSGPWPLRHLQAAFITWWLAEFEAWFDQGSGTQKDSEDGKKKRGDAFLQALRDGAFQFTLSICAYLKSHDWLDPSRLALTRSLLAESLSLPSDTHEAQPEFCEIMMEQLETFIDAFVTNMPDTLRKFKADEDDERRKLLAGLANGNTAPGSRFLETFFLIVAYAYEGRAAAAETFWLDNEGNMYGFLQWASRRQSTPVVSAFCEMFRAISEGEHHADAAHHFLLEDPSGPSSRVRKVATLGWVGILDELTYYADKIKNNPAPGPSSIPGGRSVIADFDEPESVEMLECYLRLISHLCRQSASVRIWFLQHPGFRLVDTALLLCRSNSPVRIRTCAYGCLESLLVKKSQEINDLVWTAVDQWITRDFCTKAPNKTGSSLSIEEIAFRAIASNAEESSAFTSLLGALIILPESVGPMSDQLPFPEQLGSTYRMPGLDAYVDFVFGKLLCQTLPSVQGSLQSQILAFKILVFAIACLDSFNEELIVLANQPGVNVDSGLRASSLLTYSRLHPFNRVMEWMFNERAANMLFHISHHDISELNAYPPEAPIVASVYHSVLVISKVLDLQPTFLNLLRPLLKNQPYRNDRENVIDSSIAFFEDVIASNLRIVPDLLYYGGTTHEELTLASMRLLTRITRSRKLNARGSGRGAGLNAQNRLISVLEQDHDVDPIARGLIQRLTLDARELAEGPNAPGYQSKIAILDFLQATLADVADRPNVAHVLLGLECVGNKLAVASDSSFAQADSLFHAVVRLAVEFPDAPNGSFLAWTLSLKQRVWRIAELLWSSPISSSPILADLRENGYITSRWPAQVILSSRTSFGGGMSDHDSAATVLDEFFYFGSGSDALVLYFEQRKTLLNYTATELRLAASQDLELLRAQITSTLLGTSLVEGGEIQNATIFDLLDFMELEIPEASPLKPYDWYDGLQDKIEGILKMPDTPFEDRLELVSQLLTLRGRELESAGHIRDDAARAQLRDAHEVTLFSIASCEKSTLLFETRLSLLKAWVHLMSLFLEHAVLGENDKKLFILQALQIMSPKLELFASQAQPEALLFAELGQILLSHLKIEKSLPESKDSNNALTQTDNHSNKGIIDDGTSERLFSLFRVSLRTICMPSTESALRTILYNVCYRYLSMPMDQSVAQRCIPTIKTMGEGLLDAIYEDAYGGEFACRVAALMLLEALVDLDSQYKSTYVADNMVRANFVVVLVENIKEMPIETAQTSSGDIPNLMFYYKAKLGLLIALASTRTGAGHVTNAGLFGAIAASGLFALDPDLGLDIDGSDALTRYYELLFCVLQVVVVVVLSRGPQNTQTLDQARTFLLTNRPLMVGLLKRQGRIGARDSKEQDADMQKILNDLSELYVLLISSTGFVEREEEQDTQKSRRKFFS